VPRRSLWLLAAAAVCAAGAAAVWLVLANVAEARWIDVAAAHGFLGLRRPSLVGIEQAVAHLVNAGPFVLWGLILCGVAVARGRPRLAIAVPVILIGANLTTQLLKPALALERFSEWLGAGQIPAGSWPSGHSTAAMSLALCAVLVASPRFRPAVAALGAMFAVAVGYCLVTLGWHWPSDVLGGFLVAATWTLVVAAGYRVAEARWAEGTGREAALRLRDAVTPPAVAAGVTVALVGALVALRPKPVLGYIAEHPAAATGALTIAALATVLATGVAFVFRR
jgi:membrane-associated phospholipid phosphatase